MKGTITLNNMLLFNPALFDDCKLPPAGSMAGVEEGVVIHYPAMDRDTLKNAIVLRCGNLTTINSTPDDLKAAIDAWFYVHYMEHLNLWKTYFYEYNPIENYNRYEHLADHTDDVLNRAHSKGTSENQVSPYNSVTYVEDNKNDTETTSDSDRDVDLHHESHIHGNIGVTTTQQMIQGERDIVDWNIYDVIAGRFEDFFCIALY